MLWFARRGLRVLMYHKVSPATADELTVTAAQLDAQLRWLRAAGFQFVTAADLLRGGPLPARPVLVTFDDAYVNTFAHAHPVLRALGVPAVVFVPTAFIGRTSAWDRDAQPLMDAAQLCALATDGWELGLHSHRHENYANLAPAQIAEDVRASFAAFAAHGLPVVPALAYPYGGRPRDGAAMKAALREAGVRLAFRIGNRVNPLPLADPFEIHRLGSRGDASFGAFQRKVRWGRLA
jgi:peptidoglycan/xylan/chitin deacetylase (PgdA/CDA1 family)